MKSGGPTSRLMFIKGQAVFVKDPEDAKAIREALRD